MILDGVAVSVIDARINYAEERVNGVLRQRGYPVPFSPVNDLLRGLVADLAAADLLADEVGNNGNDDEPTQSDDIRKRAERVLDDLKKGFIVLQAEVTESVPSAYSPKYSTPSKFQSWNPLDLSTYHPSQW